MRYSFLVNLTQKLLKLVNICKSCCKKFTATFLCPTVFIQCTAQAWTTKIWTLIVSTMLCRLCWYFYTGIATILIHTWSHICSTYYSLQFDCITDYFLNRALEAACAAYASLNLSLLHYITISGSSWVVPHFTQQSKMADSCHIEFRKMLIFLY